MEESLKKELKKCSGIFDYCGLIEECSDSGDLAKLKDILGYISDNSRFDDILGHSLQSISQSDDIGLEVVKEILRYEISDWQLNVAIRNCSKSVKRAEVLKYILEENPELSKDVKTFQGCCFKASPQTVELYLSLGAKDIIDEIHDNQTPLLKAIRSKDLEKVKLLVEAGADVNLKKDYATKPLEYAQKQKVSKIAEYLESKGAKMPTDDELTVSEIVLADRLDLIKNITSEDAGHALTFATNRKKTEFVLALLSGDFKFKQRDLNDAVFYLCQDYKEGAERVKIFEFLVKRGADLKAEVHYDPLMDKVRECKDLMAYIEEKGLHKGVKDHEDMIDELTDELSELLSEKINSESLKTIFIGLDVIEEDEYDEEEEDEERVKPWESTLGGNPYLTKDMEYPLLKSREPMPFFGQINFEEIPEGLFEDQPEKGLLQIFIDEVYTSEERYVFIEDVIKDESKMVDPPEFNPILKNRYRIDSDTGISSTHPFPTDTRFYEIYDKFAKPFLEEYDQSVAERVEENVLEIIRDEDSNSGHQMGGYVFFTQEDPRYGDKKGYINLIQMDELEGDGDSFVWGDAGIGHIFVSPDAFKTKDFSGTMFHFDCY